MSQIGKGPHPRAGPSTIRSDPQPSVQSPDDEQDDADDQRMDLDVIQGFAR